MSDTTGPAAPTDPAAPTSPANPGIWRGLPVLVTGAAGLVGSQTVARLLALGARVRAVWYRRRIDLTHHELSPVQADLRRPEDCRAVCAGMRRVFLCQGVTGGAASILGATRPVTQTLILGAQMLEAAVETGVQRIGLISSTTVYPASELPVREADGFAAEPFAAYAGLGWANRSLEKLAEFLHARTGLGIAILRPTSIYGPRDRFDEGANVLPSLIRRAEQRCDPFVVWGDGKAVRDFVHAADVARALVDAVEHAAYARPLNIGSGAAVTIAGLVEAVLAASGHAHARIVYDESKPNTIPVRLADLSEARRRIGYQPRIGLAEGLRDTIAWYRTGQTRGREAAS